MTIQRGSQHSPAVFSMVEIFAEAVMYWYAGKKPNGFEFSGTGVRQVFQPTKNLFHPS